jgi:acetyl-CoA C-acetyltransferase
MREVVVVSGVRTAIGTYGGSLKDVPPPNWPPKWCASPSPVRAWTARMWADVVFGHVVDAEPKDMYCHGWLPLTAAALKPRPLST